MSAEDWLLGIFGVVAVILLAVNLANPLLALFGYRIIHRRRSTPGGRHTSVSGAAAVSVEETKPSRDEHAGLASLEVSDVMVHRLAMRSINADDSPEAIVKEMLASPHTRVPLWQGAQDNIVGVLHAKDLLRALSEAGNDYSKLDIVKIAMKPWFVPDTTTLQDQLNAFLRAKSHFAIVVDEYGEVEGLLTLEEIVGEIADEHDIEVKGVKHEADGSVVVDGSVPIRDLNRAFGWALPEEEATTVAGLVIHETQSIPKEKQAFTFYGKRFVVMKRERNRITRLRIKPIVETA